MNTIIKLFNRLCVKLWLSVSTLKRCLIGLLLWLLSESYKISEIKDYQK